MEAYIAVQVCCPTAQPRPRRSRAKQYNALLTTSAPGSYFYDEGWRDGRPINFWTMSGVMSSIGVLAAAIGPESATTVPPAASATPPAASGPAVQ
jgi:hypothetical protein